MTTIYKASAEQLITERMIEKQLSWLVMYITTIIPTSVFYPHIRTFHPQILSAFYPLSHLHIRLLPIAELS